MYRGNGLVLNCNNNINHIRLADGAVVVTSRRRQLQPVTVSMVPTEMFVPVSSIPSNKHQGN